MRFADRSPQHAQNLVRLRFARMRALCLGRKPVLGLLAGFEESGVVIDCPDDLAGVVALSWLQGFAGLAVHEIAGKRNAPNLAPCLDIAEDNFASDET